MNGSFPFWPDLRNESVRLICNLRCRHAYGCLEKSESGKTCRSWLFRNDKAAACYSPGAEAVVDRRRPVLSSIARSRIQTTLQDGFASDLQIQNFKISLFPSVAMSGDSLVFRRKGIPTIRR